MIRRLTEEGIRLLQMEGNTPWQWCWACLRKPKPALERWHTPAVVICTDCGRVYCKDHSTWCPCQDDS